MEETYNPDASSDVSPDANTAAADWAIWHTFDSELDQYVADNHDQMLTPDLWKGWVWIRAANTTGQDQRQNRFYYPFVLTRRTEGETARTLDILVKYEEGREGFYDPPFAGGEVEHLDILKRWAEKQFHGKLGLTFHSPALGNDIPESQADLTVVLGHVGPYSYAEGKSIYLLYDTTFTHEFLHFLWFWHHYCGNGPTDPGEETCPERPPGERPCVMDKRKGVGDVERFTLGIPWGTPEVETEEQREIDALGEELLSHRPTNMLVAPNQLEQCGMTPEKMKKLVSERTIELGLLTE